MKYIILFILFIIIFNPLLGDLCIYDGNKINYFKNAKYEYFKIIFDDFNCIYITTEERNTIDLSVYDLEGILFIFHKSLNNILWITHNHFYTSDFSDNDIMLYWVLKDYGFCGKFAVICENVLNLLVEVKNPKSKFQIKNKKYIIKEIK